MQQRTLQSKQMEQQLRDQESLYHSAFAASNNGLLIADNEDGRFIEVNPAACTMYGYTYEEMIGLQGTDLFYPDSHPQVEKITSKLSSDGFVHAQLVARRKDGTLFPVDGRGTPFIYKGQPTILAVIRDITEQVQAEQLLEQRVEERTRELASLLEVSHTVASTIELKPLLGLILDQLKVVADYTGSSITILENEDLVLVGTRGPDSEEHLMQHRFPLKHMGLIWEMLCSRELVIIDNVRDDTPLAHAYREAIGEILETTFSYIRSWVAVPLMLKERVIGMLSASHSEPNYYTPRHAALALVQPRRNSAGVYERAGGPL